MLELHCLFRVGLSIKPGPLVVVLVTMVPKEGIFGIVLGRARLPRGKEVDRARGLEVGIKSSEPLVPLATILI